MVKKTKMNESELTGITIDGIPLVSHLDEKGDPVVAAEIKEILSDATKHFVTHAKTKYYKASKYVAHTRAKTLTDDEIRKEYGTMAKPYATKKENIIDVILKKGPISNAEIAAETGYDVANVTHVTSHMNRMLKKAEPAGIFKVVNDGGIKLYSFGEGLDLDVGIIGSLVRKGQRIHDAEKRVLKPGKVAADRRKHIPETDANAVCEHHGKHAAKSDLAEAINKLVSSVIGVEVNVTGGIRIEIVFKVG